MAIAPVIPFDTFANNMNMYIYIFSFAYPLIFINNKNRGPGIDAIKFEVPTTTPGGKTSINQGKQWKLYHLRNWGGK